MRIIVWGLGYVGTVSAACLAQLGHEIIGVEPNLTKVEALNAGHSAIKEPGLDHLVSQMVGMGRLRATQDGVSLHTLGGYVAHLCGDTCSSRWQPSAGLRTQRRNGYRAWFARDNCITMWLSCAAPCFLAPCAMFWARS